MTERERLRQFLHDTARPDPTQLYNASIDALRHGLLEEVVEAVERAVSVHSHDRRLWQILGLARRDLLNSDAARAAFARAAALAPDDALIAHSLARVTAEAGAPAVDAYRRALALAPSDGGVLLGLAVAMAGEGDGAGALVYLSDVLAANPGWYDGHAGYARLAATVGSDPAATLDRALREFPRDPALWRALVNVALGARNYPAVLRAIQRARAATGESPEWTQLEAAARSECGEASAAQALFDRLPSPGRATEAAQRVRNLLRLGRPEPARALAERSFGEREDDILWPYRALVWRVLGDRRWDWLEGDPRLIGIYDLTAAIGDLAGLADTLRALHARSGTMLDQSVRGGTQTDGNLLARSDPAIHHLHSVLRDAVAAHVEQLPPPVAGHPSLPVRRAPLRFAGAWSVRLTGSGFHVDHVHPEGWLSSALYISLPDTIGAGTQDGWLAFGECRDLLPDLDGFRTVEPKPGRLVLFPSTMWHGTRRFREGERMTVAFDVARP